MDLCKSCRAEILWARTYSDKMMPLDAEPCPDGNIYLENGCAVTIYQSKQPPAGTALYKSHFVTCPHAKRHRKKPRSA